MSDMSATPRFALPLLAVAQAQKEMTHNESLMLLDALVHAAVEAGPLATPPVGPDAGQCWIVGPNPSDGWEKQENRLALWTVNGWRFAEARAGMQVTRVDDGARLRFDGARWVSPAIIEPPTGGSTIDLKARNVIASLILQLAAQGLLIAG